MAEFSGFIPEQGCGENLSDSVSHVAVDRQARCARQYDQCGQTTSHCRVGTGLGDLTLARYGVLGLDEAEVQGQVLFSVLDEDAGKCVICVSRGVILLVILGGLGGSRTMLLTPLAFSVV